jgi:23S rRNA (cytidine1920-2'-O)/16S rRNA (cytidine1409-2'-O)-methyltransferase
MGKERLDVLVMRNGFADAREKAKRLIMAGEIYVDGQKEDKAGMRFDETAAIEFRGKNPLPYVGRGGLKLEKALAVFSPDLTGRVCMDVGASTGGFTDCMLQNGAAKVYSVDVGRGQLAWKLREDPRVVCMEKTNIRYLEPDQIDERPSFVSIDVSFISLSIVLPAVLKLIEPGGRIVCLIKPQFEAGREKVGKKGVVRDPAVHVEVIRKVSDVAEALGCTALGLSWSPIKGPEGNIEYLLYLRSASSEEENADRTEAENADRTEAENADRSKEENADCSEVRRDTGNEAPPKEAVTAEQEKEAVGAAHLTDETISNVVRGAHKELDCAG